MTAHVVEGLDLAKSYRRGSLETQALAGVTVAVDPADFVVILGPSGSGKSTLLHLLGALDSPSRGRVLLFGEDIASKNDHERSLLRRARLGFIFQSFHLIPALSALENVLVPRVPAGVTDADRERARSLLEKIGLGSRLHHRPDELSGGESQRVAIARALIGKPRLILADEPTGELDGPTGAAIVKELRDAARQDGAAVIVVTHDERLVQPGDRVLRLRDGKLETDERRA